MDLEYFTDARGVRWRPYSADLRQKWATIEIEQAQARALEAQARSESIKLRTSRDKVRDLQAQARKVRERCAILVHQAARQREAEHKTRYVSASRPRGPRPYTSEEREAARLLRVAKRKAAYRARFVPKGVPPGPRPYTPEQREASRLRQLARRRAQYVPKHLRPQTQQPT